MANTKRIIGHPNMTRNPSSGVINIKNDSPKRTQGDNNDAVLSELREVKAMLSLLLERFK